MGGKIIGSEGDVIFEFKDGLNIEILLSGLIMRAKFNKGYDNLILSNDWVNELLAALKEARPDDIKKFDNTPLMCAPDSFLEEGMTHKDWDLRDFFHDITLHISQSTSLLELEGWKDMNMEARQTFLRKVVFPHPISDARLVDMIEEIDFSLQAAASVYNPNF